MLHHFFTSYYRLTVIITMVCIIQTASLSGQTNPDSTNLSDRGLEAAIRYYHTSRGEHLKLYNGVEFPGYLPARSGIPFYKSPDTQKGEVEYDRILYRNVSLKYDVVKDNLIVIHPANSRLIILDRGRVSYFTISGDRFLNTTAHLKEYGLPAGFIQVVVTGEILLLIKRVSVLEENLIELQNVKNFEQVDQYFAIKNGKLHTLSRKKDLLKLTGDRKEKVNQFARKNELRFKKNKEKYLENTIRFYNQIN